MLETRALEAEQAFSKGDWATAVRLCTEALTASPENPLAHRVLGMTLTRTGRPEQAIPHFKQALHSQPNDFLCLEWLQGALMQTGRYPEAVEFGEKARSLRPRDVNILIGLSQACFKAALHPRAAHCLETARGLEPGNAAVHHLLGQAYEKLKRNRDAMASYREAIRLDPRLGDAYDRANRILLEDGRFAPALRLCEAAFAALPEYGQAHLQEAQALWALGRPDEAADQAEQAVQLDPGLAWAAATWLQSCGRLEAATTMLERSIQENPVQGRAYYGLVKSRRITEADRPLVDQMEALLGTTEARTPEGSQNLARGRQTPGAGGSLGSTTPEGSQNNQMADLGPAPATARPRSPVREVADPDLSAPLPRSGGGREGVEEREDLGSVGERGLRSETVADPPKSPTSPEMSIDSVQITRSAPKDLPPKERVALLRALGKASDDLGAYESAMAYFDEAASLGIKAFAAENAFDPRRLDAARESFLRIFDQRFLAKHADIGRTGASPIFVIGMIRSGTTLVHQILTSHPNIGDAGEQPFWTTEFPVLVHLDRGELRRDALVEARDRYLDVLRRFDRDAPVVANKWPMNYAHAGLLLLAYPDAKVIHVARDPLDTALSIWMTDLGEPRPEFSYKKEHIVAVYRDYQARMRHWNQVLPEGSILTVRYEDLVADQETWSRKLIEFCNQPWHDRCLTFHEGARRINTPSMLQARTPIYATSVGKWQRYRPWLGEFAELRSEESG